VKIPAIILLVLLSFNSYGLYAQDSTSLVNRIINFPDKLFGTLNQKSADYERKLQQKSTHYLQKLAKKEKRLKKKLLRTDSALAAKLFSNSDSLYAAMQQKAEQSAATTSRMNQVYNGHLDSMQTALQFLEQNKLLTAGDKIPGSLQSTLKQYESLQKNLNQTEQLQQLIQQRQQYLKAQLQKVGMVKELKALQKEVYYYQQQVREYKEIFEHPEKLERKLLQLANEFKPFKDFFAKYSLQGQLFGIPANYGTPQAIVGMQTRDQIQNLVRSQMSTSSLTQVDPRQYVQSQMQSAQAQIGQLKNNLNKLGLDGESGDMQMPDFSTNKQRGKTFLRRLEYGFNMQHHQSNAVLPSTSDLGLSVGYKLNDKSLISIGSCYKMGWGNGFKHIKFSNQGLGLRSNVDIKAKGKIWITGGYEYNYMHQFAKLSEISNPDIWQQSALVGISKKYKISKNKQRTIQVLYDFLAKRQSPQAQPLKFRLGYSF
jgi:myosin heavy subunit